MNAWRGQVMAARAALDDWTDQVELMLEEEVEATAEEALEAHEGVEDATAYLFDEVGAAAALILAVEFGDIRYEGPGQ